MLCTFFLVLSQVYATADKILDAGQIALLTRFADSYERICGTRALGLSAHNTPLAIDDPSRFVSSGKPKDDYNSILSIPIAAYQSCSHVRRSLSRLRPDGDAFIAALSLPPVVQTVFRKLPNAKNIFGFLPDQPEIGCSGLDTALVNKMMLQAKWLKDRHAIWVMHLYQLGSVYNYVLTTCGTKPALIDALTTYLNDALKLTTLLAGYSTSSTHNFFEDVATDPSDDPVKSLRTVLCLTFPEITFESAEEEPVPDEPGLRLAVINDGKLAQDGCMLGSLLRWLAKEKVPFAVLSEGVASEGRLGSDVGDGYVMTNPARRGKDEEGSKGGGVGLLWEKSQTDVTSRIAVNAEDNVSISVLDLGYVKVIGMYLQPGSDRKTIATIMKAATKLYEVIGNSPAIVTGDMNCEGGSRRRAVLDTAMHSLGLTLANRGQLTFFSRVSKIPRDLDLIFITEGITLSQLKSFPKVRANDHDRVIATFQFAAPTLKMSITAPDDASLLPGMREDLSAMGAKRVFVSPQDDLELALTARAITEISRLQFTDETSQMFVLSLNLTRAVADSRLPFARDVKPEWPLYMQRVLQLSFATSDLSELSVVTPGLHVNVRTLLWQDGLLVFTSSAEELQATYETIERRLRLSGMVIHAEDVAHINYPDSLGFDLRVRTGETVPLSRWLSLPGKNRLTALPSRLDFLGEPDDMFKLWFKYNMHQTPIETNGTRAECHRMLAEVIIPQVTEGFLPSLPSFAGFGRVSNQIASFIDGAQLNQSFLLPKRVVMSRTLKWVHELIHNPGQMRRFLRECALRVIELLKTTPARSYGIPADKRRVLPQRAWSTTYFGSLHENMLKPLSLHLTDLMATNRTAEEWAVLVDTRVADLPEPIFQAQIYGDQEDEQLDYY